MTHSLAPTGLQLRSLIKADGELEISLHEVPTPEPAADEVIVRVEATPIASRARWRARSSPRRCPSGR